MSGEAKAHFYIIVKRSEKVSDALAHTWSRNFRVQQLLPTSEQDYKIHQTITTSIYHAYPCRGVETKLK
jgi:hypothetical protein